MPRPDLTPAPSSRTLRVFAFDPSLATQIDNAGIAEIAVAIPWEPNLQPGPVGEYVEVVDVDPASNLFYPPVDLNDPRILAQDGLPPSESNPQFHQQMVYAVAMATIAHFEQALGRVALWSSHRPNRRVRQFVRRLRIYPHALRDRNAFYSPDKKALLFGYFPTTTRDAHNTPGTLVFTALSHDIVAHETTHALLDGVHPRFNEPVNHDVLAFHEAFSDIVALFQHFAYPGVLRDQIRRTRGDLAGESLLGQLAQQFGRASGRGGALRDALGEVDDATGEWRPRKPSVRALDTTHEPHDRGAILVAAVFGAFLKAYRHKTADLYRIASDGTGVLRAGAIHPDLTHRLATEAERCAKAILQMCIRAIDYCPPVGITFGDYLRALLTADVALFPEDSSRFRLAMLESFRQWGIHPEGLRVYSEESLLWPTLTQVLRESADVHREWSAALVLRSLFEATEPAPKAPDHDPLNPLPPKIRNFEPWNLEGDRYQTWKGAESNARILWDWLVKGPGLRLTPALGLAIYSSKAPATIFRSETYPRSLAIEVHSVRTAQRRTARGSTVTDLVVEITQRRRGFFDPEVQKRFDNLPPGSPMPPKCDFIHRAGCTLIIDAESRCPDTVRVIRTPGDITDNARLEAVRRFLCEGGLEPANAFEGPQQQLDRREPFALIHRHGEH